MARNVLHAVLAVTSLAAGGTVQALPISPPRPPALAPVPTPTPTKGAGRLGVAVPRQVNALRQMQVDPTRLDFPPLWSGESARKTVSFTASVAGPVAATAPQTPFAIAEIRVVAAELIPTGNSKMPLTHVRARRIAPPWQVSCAAGEKSATLALRGPSTYGSWDVSVPLAGLFNGKRLLPLMTIPNADATVTVSPTAQGQVPLVIRFVSTGEAFEATVEAFDTSRFGLRGTEWKVSVPSGGTVELPMWMVVNPSNCCSWAPADVPLKAYYTAGTSKGTISATLRWTVVPDPYVWKDFFGTCNNLRMAGTVTLASSGLVTFDAQQWSPFTEPLTETVQFGFNGPGNPLSKFEVTAPPLPGQKTSYDFHLDVGPP